MQLQDLQDKNVAIWGAGKDGESALGCIRKRFPEQPLVVLSDQKIPASRQDQLCRYAPVDFVFQDAVAQRLCQCDIVIKSPGISIYRDEIDAARKAGTVFTATAHLWFSELKNCSVIGVTGTKGKSTTASIIHHCLKKSGIASELCGNIGRPFLDYLDTAPGIDIWVAEFSSYQLADFNHFPQIALLVNLFPEHLDWHRSLDNYYRDKLRLFKPGKDRHTILNHLDENTRRFTAGWSNVTYFEAPGSIHVRGDEIYQGSEKLGRVPGDGLQGRHNLGNVCAGLTALAAAGLDPMGCLETLTDFVGLPHRQQLLGQKDGLTFVDDSISTTPETAIAAIERFSGPPITLLLGGFDRRQNYQALANIVCSKNIPLVISLPANGPKIASLIRKTKTKLGTGPDIIEANDLTIAVQEAIRRTPKGGVVLLSPAAPSYGSFTNFEDRGRVFQNSAGFD